jgi:putative DNA primase/helicase
LLIDEADTFLQGKEELRGILNAGYSRESAYVVRVGSERQKDEGGMQDNGSTESRPSNYGPPEGGTPNVSGLRKFSCWCPKVIAGIGELPETLADRCIVLTMQRKKAGEACERLRKLQAEEWRRKCARFVEDNASAIASAEPAIPECLNDRAADIWEPLLVVADIAGGLWPELARETAEGLSGGKEDMSQWGMLLQHIRLAFQIRQTEKLFSRTLVALLSRVNNPGWAELKKGRVVTEFWLAQQLKKVGIAPRTVWIEGTTGKGYHLEDFAEAFARYAAESSKSQIPSSKEAPSSKLQ